MKDFITALQNPEAYPHDVSGVQVIQTHISAVFLTGEFAYKICKSVDFGFLDFSTLEKRKETTEKEVEFNRLISPELYLGVVPIKENNGIIKVDGPEGEVIEYAMKMKQCSQKNIMSNLLTENKISTTDMEALAERIWQFHQKAPRSEEISQYGKLETIKFNWDENFKQTANIIPDSITDDEVLFVQQKVHLFMDNNKELFAKRITQNKIKHCHGDLHTGNIFVEDNKFLIFDGIVFNKRFPNTDIISDFATLVADLEFHDKPELAEAVIKKYQELSQDEDLSVLLPFYNAYRAYVKVKVICLTYQDENVPATQKEELQKAVRKYFDLALKYAKEF